MLGHILASLQFPISKSNWISTNFEGPRTEHGHGGVVNVDVYEGVGEPHGGVCLVVHVALLPGHELARRRLARPRRPRQPEDLALLPGVGLDVGTAEGLIEMILCIWHVISWLL